MKRTKCILIFIFLLANCPCLLAQEEDPFKDYDPYCAALFFPKEETLKFYENFLKDIGIRNGETVADIGGASGWKSILRVVLKDKKNEFYIEDIDSSCLNQKNFDKTIKWYYTQAAQPVDDTFHFTIGDEKSTRLPKDNFDRAILYWTYHEITYKNEMLADIKSILKNNGVLVIVENIAKKHGKIRKDCGHEMPTKDELLRDLVSSGFSLSKTTESSYQKGLVFFEFVK